MDEIKKYIPLDKSWIMRMGILDMMNGYHDIQDFLDKQKNLGDDLIALKNISKSWNNPHSNLNVGESGTLYRFIKFALWKNRAGENRQIEKEGTLKYRQICENPEIINWSTEKLLTLDNGTSQWASASVLLGNKERIENPPFKLQTTYDAVAHWKSRREKGLLWEPRYDETIKRQALSFMTLLKTGKIKFIPGQAEDYCFARAFNLITQEEGKRKFPSLRGHETDRISEMERIIQKLNSGSFVVDSKDHRVVQGIVMWAMYKNKEIIVDKKSTNKSWPQFWDFMKYCEDIIKQSSLRHRRPLKKV